MADTPRRLHPVLLLVHWALILNFVAEMAYAGYMVFAVIVPEGGGSGPLFAQARTMPFELMVTRRLYAIEFWIATAGLAIYLGLTEIGPRRRRMLSEPK